jgi:chromate transporter
MTTAMAATDLFALFSHFLMLSLLAIGGAIIVAPDMHRVLVGEMGALSDAQFAASIAIGQAAPGPNVLFVAVLGYQAAGLPGVVVTLLGIMLPSTTLALAASRWSDARQHWLGVRAFKAGMAPITISLLVATGWILSAQSPTAGLIIVTCIAALLVWLTRLHLLWMIAGGAIAGIAGWV